MQIGDRVVPKDETYGRYSRKITKGKEYIVVECHGGMRVYDDTGVTYWSSPELFFDVVETICLGGE